jgi:hypothetical protein
MISATFGSGVEARLSRWNPLHLSVPIHLPYHRGGLSGNGSDRTVDWSSLSWEGRFRERKLGPAKAHYLWWLTASEEPNI